MDVTLVIKRKRQTVHSTVRRLKFDYYSKRNDFNHSLFKKKTSVSSILYYFKKLWLYFILLTLFSGFFFHSLYNIKSVAQSYMFSTGPVSSSDSVK